jgi:60 kDa SS-A/Ro ribonucleoprotein
MRYLLQAVPKGMTRNSAGGASFAVDDWSRLDRFIILGSEGGSYYASERELTTQNCAAVMRCLAVDGPRAVERIAQLSESGRAAKNDPAIFALALASNVASAKTAAMAAFPRVCRTGSHLLTLVKMLKGYRGFGRALRRAIAGWYGSRQPAELAYQLLKYRQRGQWSHRDALRLSHAAAPSPQHQALYRYAVGASPAAREVKRGLSLTCYPETSSLPELVTDFESLQAAVSAEEACRILEANPNLSWEMVPSELLSSPKVWHSLQPNLAMTALLRNLGRMTANGSLQANIQPICERLTCREALQKARLHPLALLTALAAYRLGSSRSGLSWTPISQIVLALEAAFYLSFGNVQPAGKRTLIGLDVSGSMSCPLSGSNSLSCATAATAMAMVTVRTEPWCRVMAFSDKFIPVDIHPNDRLEHVMERTSRISFGSTDCSLPMLWALDNKIEVDTFVVYTDSETWCDRVKPDQALRCYRAEMGIAARLIVVAMVANQFSIADPDDGGMLDVVGFDTAAPEQISAFSRGEL